MSATCSAVPNLSTHLARFILPRPAPRTNTLLSKGPNEMT